MAGRSAEFGVCRGENLSVSGRFGVVVGRVGYWIVRECWGGHWVWRVLQMELGFDEWAYFVGCLCGLSVSVVGYRLSSVRSKYGDLVTIHLGPDPVVVVSGYKLLKEAMLQCGEDFCGRAPMPFFYIYNDFGFGFTTNIERWRELRKFSLNVLKEVGMGKKSNESAIQEEAKQLVDTFRKTKGQPFVPIHCLAKATCNVICSTMFNKRYDYEDEELKSLIHAMHDCFYLMNTFSGQMYNTFPSIMKYLPGSHVQVRKNLETLMKFVDKRVQMNLKTLDPNSPRDYVDAFLIKLEKEKQNPNTEYHLDNLITSTLQIFFAGTETTSTTLAFGLLLFIKHQDVQKKVQEEINKVIGQNRSPSYQDKSQMPYTEAVIHEILRFSDIAPYSMPRSVTQDIQFHGYDIPKGTNAFLLLSSVLNDPEIFPNPQDFNPGNFLDADGRFKKCDAFMVFAPGKRNCIGESLARMEIFIFLTTILQNFNLRSPLLHEDIDTSAIVSGLVKFPKPYELIVEPR
ncbi:cytochrome P450 2A3-like [Rhinophrynus dorsalis]